MISFKDYQEQICETADTGLAAKASKSGISIGTLRKVYRRGVAAWNSGHRPGTTPQQWGMARVNSYIGKGKGTYGGADKDLHEEQLSESGGEVVWKKNNKHIEKYSDDAFALYVDGKKQKFFTSIEAAKSASDCNIWGFVLSALVGGYNEMIVISLFNGNGLFAKGETWLKRCNLFH